MSDFEILSIVIGIITLVIAAASFGYKAASDKEHKRKNNRHHY